MTTESTIKALVSSSIRELTRRTFAERGTKLADAYTENVNVDVTGDRVTFSMTAVWVLPYTGETILGFVDNRENATRKQEIEGYVGEDGPVITRAWYTDWRHK